MGLSCKVQDLVLEPTEEPEDASASSSSSSETTTGMFLEDERHVWTVEPLRMETFLFHALTDVSLRPSEEWQQSSGMKSDGRIHHQHSSVCVPPRLSR